MWEWYLLRKIEIMGLPAKCKKETMIPKRGKI